MDFKINSLFTLVVFSMFSIGYSCNSKSSSPPLPSSSPLPPLPPSERPERPSFCDHSFDYGYCDETDTIGSPRWQTKFFYLQPAKNCYPFDYFGCGKSENKFDTYKECMNICSETNPYIPYQ